MKIECTFAFLFSNVIILSLSVYFCRIAYSLNDILYIVDTRCFNALYKLQ